MPFYRKKARIVPYKFASESARHLATGLRVKKRNSTNNPLEPDANSLFINWGCTAMAQGYWNGRIINSPDTVNAESNKLNFFRRFSDQGIRTPYFWTNKAAALEWMYGRADRQLVARTKLTSHSGNGIQMIGHHTPQQQIVNAPLYTQYIKKKDEYRIHFMNGRIFFIQRKARVRGVEEVNWQIRNHHHGFIYANDNIVPPVAVSNAAQSFLLLTALNFGALDIIYQQETDHAFILEVNTAPGLVGRTVDAYVAEFQRNYPLE